MLVGGGAGGWVAPLIALLAKGNQSPVVRAHALAALNFQLTWSIVGLIGLVTTCIVIGFIVFPIAMLIGLIFGVVAGVKANEGQLYQYPLSVTMVR